MKATGSVRGVQVQLLALGLLHGEVNQTPEKDMSVGASCDQLVFDRTPAAEVHV